MKLSIGNKPGIQLEARVDQRDGVLRPTIRVHGLPLATSADERAARAMCLHLMAQAETISATIHASARWDIELLIDGRYRGIRLKLDDPTNYISARLGEAMLVGIVESVVADMRRRAA